MNRNGLSIDAMHFFAHIRPPLWRPPLWAALPLLGGFAGWLAFEDPWLIHHGAQGNVAQGFLVGASLLALGWRTVRRSRDGFALMLGWYLGACLAIPGIWAHFFGGQVGGILTWAGLSLLLAAAYLLPGRWARFGWFTGLLLTLLPPLGLVGMASPLLAAGAFFPGSGVWGIALLLLFFLLSGLRHRFADVAAILMMFWGVAHVGQPLPQAPPAAWGMQSYEGAMRDADSIPELFARQDRFKALTRQAIEQGAKLIVLPEGSDPAWDDGQAFYWRDIADLAKKHDAQVLLGVYTRGFPPSKSQDGLVDLTTGKIYPAGIPMPIGMFKPWDRNPQHINFPLDLWRAQIIPTTYGPAAYSICYENLLLWPTLLAALHHPKMLIASANQWFAKGDLSEPQMRSLQMQAALFGLPLLKAVNWPRP